MSRPRAWAASAGRGTSTAPSGRTRARETPRRRRGARRRGGRRAPRAPRAAHNSRRLTRIRASAVTEVPVIVDELSRRVSSRVSLGSPNLRASCAVIFPASSGRLLGDGGGLRVGRVRRPHARCGGGTGFDGVADALRGPSCLRSTWARVPPRSTASSTPRAPHRTRRDKLLLFSPGRRLSVVDDSSRAWLGAQGEGPRRAMPRASRPRTRASRVSPTS